MQIMEMGKIHDKPFIVVSNKWIENNVIKKELDDIAKQRNVCDELSLAEFLKTDT